MLKKIIQNIIFVALLIILGISISPALPFKNIPRTYVVVSGSMEPTIKTGSIVLTKPVDPKTITTGDVVAFTSPSNSKDVILHRIAGIKSESPLRFQTKGDNNNSPDAWDLMDVGILGKQVFAVPYIGHIAAFVRTPIGFGLIIVLPALLFIISQILNIKKYIKQEIDKQVKSKTLPVLFFFLSFFSVSSLLYTTSALAKLYSTATVSSVSFSIKDFAPPSIPTLLSPPDNITRKTDGMVMDWSDVLDYQNQHNPVYYIYQSSHLANFFSLVYQSGHLSSSQIPAPGTPNGVYYWRVKSCDSVDNCSMWSDVWTVTVDNTPPESVLEEIPYNYNQSILTIGYSASDNFQVDHTDLCYTFNDEITESCTTNFNFNFPRGEGTYYFYTMATDQAGNVEDPTITLTNATIYDYTPPTTNLDLNTSTPSFSGQNLISGIGTSFYLDNFGQHLFLPQNLSSNLTFSFKYYSEDYPEYANLNVGVSTSNGFFDILNFGGTDDFDWQTVSHSLLQWSGQTVGILFKLTRLDPSYLTTTILRDINISPLDLRTGDTTPPQFLATDLGTGVFDSTTLPETISSVDLAGNTESTHSISIVTLPPVVLNKITSSTVTLYNNTDSSVDLSTYGIDIGTTTILSGTIPSFSSLDIPLVVGGTQVSLLNNSSLVDSTVFETLVTDTWQRQQNGLGPWVRIAPAISFDLQSRLSQSKVTFTASGLGDTSINMDYTINYSDIAGPQQFAGTILPLTIDSNHTVSRDFFLGTCSSGTCVSATGIGSSFLVTFSGAAKTFILN